MMESDGIFWLPSKPEEQVPGRFRFDTADGGTLTLIGSFGGLDTFNNTDERVPYQRILGIAGKKLLTLDRCLETSKSFEVPGFLRQAFHVSHVLAGAHFENDEALAFESITVTIDNLPQWLGRTGLSFSIEEREGEVQRLRLELNPLPSEEVTTEAHSVELTYSYGVNGDHLTRSTFENGAGFRLSRPNPSGLFEDLYPLAGALQDLVTIAVDAPCLIDTVRLRHMDLIKEMPSGKQVHEPVELWLQNRDRAKTLSKPRLGYEMLFTFEQIGGLEGVSRWLDVASEYRPALDSLLSLRYGGVMYVESRLLNMVQAAETFHRLRFPNHVRPPEEYKAFKRALVNQVQQESRQWLHEQLQYSNEPRLKQRLLDLAEFAGDPFTLLVGDVEPWAEGVKEARNSLVHHDGNRSRPKDGTLIRHMSESLFYLVVLCLLRQCNVSDELLGRVSENRRYQWLRRVLAEAMSNADPSATD